MESTSPPFLVVIAITRTRSSDEVIITYMGSETGTLLQLSGTYLVWMYDNFLMTLRFLH
jgi:hypothetical protein